MASARRFAEILADAAGTIGAGRHVPLCVSWRVCDVVRDATGQPRWSDVGEDEILRVGGTWDRADRAWCEGETSQGIVLRVVRGGGQERAARWFARWFAAHLTGNWEGFARAWSAMLLGGRRSGKTHVAVMALVTYWVACPGAIVWGVSPTQTETAELERAIRSMVPADWFRYRGGGAGRDVTFTSQHGAELLLLSGHNHESLRRGRVDFALYNEGQLMSQAGYLQIRSPIADVGGLVVIACNPPSSPIGRWIEEHADGIDNGRIEGVRFALNPEENPWIEPGAMSSLESEVDEDTYARDVRGELRPVGDLVMHAWSDRESRRAVPDGLIDVTESETRRVLEVGRPWLVGMDFQSLPHMAAVVYKLFRDPEHPNDVIAWGVGEVVVPEADEEELVAAIEHADRWTPAGYQRHAGYTGDECAVVMDASGWFQDGEHTKGRTSDLRLRQLGWRALFMPQKDSKRNPDIVERVKVANARLKTQDGRRHLFFTPECVEVARAFRRWENRQGVPHRRSPFAHVADAATYPLYRFWGRPAARRAAVAYRSVERRNRRDEV